LTALVNLEFRRRAVQASLQKAIENISIPILTASCSYKNELVHSYFYSLHLSSLWPLSERFLHASLSTLIERIPSFPEIKQYRSKCHCELCGTSYKPLLLGIRTKLLSSTIGLCLDCVKGGGSDLKNNNRVCRFGHPEAL
jgi:hypothetical protein